ncbi:hypothetical protein BC831DRAFT_440718 [Entophlyctis helioformis]|nr:hypothetical protein BC831DRAFT_440718 [Entophlyctis helioformis]
MVVPGVYFLSQMSFGVRMLGFVGSTCSIYAVLAAECVNMLRMALLRLPPRHAAAGEQVLGSSTIPDSAIALRSKVPATPPVTPLSIAAQ